MEFLILILFLILDPVLLLLLLKTLAKNEGKVSWGSICLICVPVAILVQGSLFYIGLLGMFFYILLYPFALVQFCSLKGSRAVLVTGVFVVVRVILQIVVVYLVLSLKQSGG